MTIETIKASIDRKIDRDLKDDTFSTFPEIITKLEATIENFKKLQSAESDRAEREKNVGSSI
jgi:hypothetical protein